MKYMTKDPLDLYCFHKYLGSLIEKCPENEDFRGFSNLGSLLIPMKK